MLRSCKRISTQIEFFSNISSVERLLIIYTESNDVHRTLLATKISSKSQRTNKSGQIDNKLCCLNKTTVNQRAFFPIIIISLMDTQKKINSKNFLHLGREGAKRNTGEKTNTHTFSRTSTSKFQSHQMRLYIYYKFYINTLDIWWITY